MANSESLLIESPHSDSDVADLQLIPPVTSRTRRKKFFSKKSPKTLESVENSGQTKVKKTFYCSAIFSAQSLLTLVIFSIIVGLAVLSLFTISLCNELDQLKKALKDRTKPSMLNADSNHSNDFSTLNTRMISLEQKCRECCSNQSTHQISTKTNPLPQKIDFSNNLTAVTNRLVSLEELIQNVTKRTKLLEEEEKCSSGKCQTSDKEYSPVTVQSPSTAENISSSTTFSSSTKFVEQNPSEATILSGSRLYTGSSKKQTGRGFGKNNANKNDDQVVFVRNSD